MNSSSTLSRERRVANLKETEKKKPSQFYEKLIKNLLQKKAIQELPLKKERSNEPITLSKQLKSTLSDRLNHKIIRDQKQSFIIS